MAERPKIFREVKEGQGGTLQLKDDRAEDIGTCMLNTCVGIYFKVDYERCFFAHIDVRSAEVRDYPVATDAVGLEMKAQVKNRLLGFLEVDQWDIEHPEFGKDLYLQCPEHTKRLLYWTHSPTTSWFTIQAIREFFLACAVYLEEEVDRREKSDISTYSPEARASWDEKTAIMKERVADLQEKATHAEVHRNHHAFIVCPFELEDRRIVTLGLYGDDGTANPSDVADYEKIKPKPELTNDLCRLGVEKDDVLDMIGGLGAKEVGRERRRVEYLRAYVAQMVRDALNKFKSFGEGHENTAAPRLKKLLDDINLPIRDFEDTL